MGRMLTKAGCTISQHIARVVAMSPQSLRTEDLIKCCKCGQLLAINEGYQDEKTKKWYCEEPECDEARKEEEAKQEKY